jgi:hypothetical protein
MAIEIKEIANVEALSAGIGISTPVGFCALPRGFETARALADLQHESSALDVKVLLREANIHLTIYQPDGVAIPYLQENDNTWVGPTLFFGVTVLTQQPELISVALSVISNFLTEHFRGRPEPSRARFSVIRETTETKTTKKVTNRYEFDGPPEQMAEFIAMIKEQK